MRGEIGGIGRAPDFVARGADGHLLVEDGLENIQPDAAHAALILRLFEWIEDHNGGMEMVAIGHRVVHGGLR